MLGLFKRASGATDQMKALNTRGMVCAGRLELACRIHKASDSRMVVQLERPSAVSGHVVVVDLQRGLAFDAAIVSSRAREMVLDVRTRHNLAGLVPARLSRARDIWKRA